jgi:hypothetical protein
MQGLQIKAERHATAGSAMSARAVLAASAAALALATLTGCGPDSATRAAAVQMATQHTTGCLDRAGYNRTPEVLASSTDDKVGLIYHSKFGAPAIRVEVVMAAKQIYPLTDGDLARLHAAGCS